MKLIAPNGKKIISILLNDGTSSNFSLNLVRSSGETLLSYTLPSERSAEVLIKNNDRVLIDESGNEWPATDVEYHSSGLL